MTESQALHRSILTVDTHIDIPWPDRGDIAQETSYRHVDLPKLRRGGIAAACLVAYVGQGPTDADTHAAIGQQALDMLDAIGRSGATGEARICPLADEIEAAFRDGVTAIVPAVENGYAMGEDLSLLARFRAKGARYMTLTHNGHNALADSARPSAALGDVESRHGGLSGLGREAIAEMNRLGLMVDISHTARSTMMQAVRLSRSPVLATHSCVRALCDHPRNLDDEQLDALRDCGGVVHITAVDAFLRPREARRKRPVNVADYVDHIDYVVDRIGVGHVGISSDFDGGGTIEGWRNAAQSPALTAELLRRGYDAAQIAAIWGGNFLRVLRAAEDVAAS
ncbi:Membrane dipeptidase [Gluconacetobacter diazotrophicus PA1 5]|uniref:Putative peptidase n=1 Tax=Gluconacetobacter diazotrophicus (strain ATCC 49037 / DSM 5601 / CCUG 37298 / CIP 103539 / LMG 7603 / PAl5) TaxID=272568 RepID=A9HFJ9_GLUDA|nr:dipeptidase [Gluconacetobacter diazotrophicus]ACI51890.1 Membrane dipeptidase [Gluconacetobacter diazotrophicus PA1 5]TWB11235.1 membrane dipeptidase [Gluconacetobacter diazotrophicus]CAP55373.1 putative peptidase [Gluconacetobacter diazotrophicus PA1 5]